MIASLQLKEKPDGSWVLYAANLNVEVAEDGTLYTKYPAKVTLEKVLEVFDDGHISVQSLRKEANRA